MSDDAKFISLLRPGKAQVISSYELARQLNVAQRSIGFRVNRLRQEGHLIGSIHGEGYYLIDSVDELNATVAHIEKRKAGIDQTIVALEEAWYTRS